MMSERMRAMISSMFFPSTGIGSSNRAASPAGVCAVETLSSRVRVRAKYSETSVTNARPTAASASASILARISDVIGE
jgi:hypothetical protein